MIHEKVKSRMANLPMEKRKELKVMCGTGFNFVLYMEVFLGMSGAGASPLAYLLWAAELKGMKLVRGGREGDGVYLQAHHTENPIGQSGLLKCDCKEKEDLPSPLPQREGSMFKKAIGLVAMVKGGNCPKWFLNLETSSQLDVKYTPVGRFVAGDFENLEYHSRYQTLMILSAKEVS